jgi:hypothetical protein
MAFDAHANFGVSSVAVAPSPSTTGTSLTVATGEGTRFPAAPFNATLAPSGVLATPANAEIVRVTARSGDVLTITRAQEGSVARAVVVGDLCVASITAKALQDIETTPYARTDAANIFTAQVQQIQAVNPLLQWVDTSQPANAKTFRVMNSTQLLVIDVLDDASGIVARSYVNRGGDVGAWRDLYEKQRTTPLGHWITVPYNAANFTAATGSWTVTSGQVVVNKYTRMGRTLIWTLYLSGSTLSASTSAAYVLLPAGTGLVGLDGMTKCAICQDSVAQQPNAFVSIADVTRIAIGVYGGNLAAGNFVVGFTISVEVG